MQFVMACGRLEKCQAVDAYLPYWTGSVSGDSCHMPVEYHAQVKLTLVTYVLKGSSSQRRRSVVVTTSKSTSKATFHKICAGGQVPLVIHDGIEAEDSSYRKRWSAPLPQACFMLRRSDVIGYALRCLCVVTRTVSRDTLVHIVLELRRRMRRSFSCYIRGRIDMCATW